MESEVEKSASLRPVRIKTVIADVLDAPMIVRRRAKNLILYILRPGHEEADVIELLSLSSQGRFGRVIAGGIHDIQKPLRDADPLTPWPK